MANNPYVNKVVFGNEVLIDTSNVTVDETSLEAGKTALNAAGAQITGTRTFVDGVKGNAETTYRTGNVNLTPENIGALPITGGTLTDSLSIGIPCDIAEQDNGVSSDTIFKEIKLIDNKGSYIGYLRVYPRTDGSTVLSLMCSNHHVNQTNTYSGGISMTHYKDGSFQYTINYPEAFRTAISAKGTQTAVTDPTASGTAVAFIDTISQNTQGVITATKKTVRSATQSQSGLMSSNDKTKLDGIASGAQVNPGAATQSAAGLMSASDKTKLDGIASGAQVNSITGVKGNAESSYRTGNVNLTPANLGAYGAGSLGNIIDANSTLLYGTGLYQANACANLPTSAAGVYYTLLCFGNAQIAIRYYGSNGSPLVYNRYYANGQWYPWTAIANVDSSGLIPVTAGGTGASTAAGACANLGAKATQTAVSSPSASGNTTSFIDTISQNAQGVITATKKTVSTASTSAAGLMSASDKTKLDGIASGAQVNSITGVKGNAESSYRTGNVNLTPANIGALPTSGGTLTGALTTNSDIKQTAGYIRGADETSSTNHAIKLGHTSDNVLNFYEYGGVFNFYKSQSGTNTLLAKIDNQSIKLYNSDGNYRVELRVDTEGGNIRIYGPAGTHYYEIDAYNNSTFRVYAYYDNAVQAQLIWTPSTNTLSSNISGNAANVTGTIAVNHGGTGATTAAGACANLGAACAIFLTSTDTTWTNVYTALNVLGVNYTATIRAGNNASSKVSGGKITTGFSGTVCRIDANTFEFLVKDSSASYQNRLYSFRLTNLTTSSGTPGTVYAFTGTAL